MSVNLPFGLKFKNRLLIHDKFHSLLNQIHDLVKGLHQHEDLRGDPELILLVCNLVENLLGKNKFKIDKKELVIAILDKVYNLTDEEKQQLDIQVQFLYDNGKIQKVSWVKLAMHYTTDWVFRKFL
jgi:hypothetical protein